MSDHFLEFKLDAVGLGPSPAGSNEYVLDNSNTADGEEKPRVLLNSGGRDKQEDLESSEYSDHDPSPVRGRNIHIGLCRRKILESQSLSTAQYDYGMLE